MGLPSLPVDQLRADQLSAVEDPGRQVELDPDLAERTATSVLAATDDPDVASAAHRMRGLARARRGDNAAATRDLVKAIKIADRVGLARRGALARLSLVVVHAADGRFDLALDQADRARPWLSGPDRGELLAQRGVALARLGQAPAALRSFAAALRLLDPRTQPIWCARVHLNRGLVLTYRGDLVAAEVELERSRVEFGALRLAGGVGMASQNIGYLHTLRGDIPAALEWLDEAERMKLAVGMDTASTSHDRAEALLSVGLAAEARGHAATAVAGMTRQGRGADLAEARLTLARAASLVGDHAGARRAAGAALRAFMSQERPGWAAIARQIVLRARWDGGERSARLIAEARICAEDLDRAGWRTTAMQARVLLAQALLDGQHRSEAAVELALASRARRRGAADLRVAAWHVEALLRLAHGDRSGALRAASAGLDVVDAHSAALGATDLRAQSMTRGRPLAQLGLDLVIARNRPRDVLRWLERARTTALRRRPARPPRDARLAAQLAELRQVTSAISQERGRGADTVDLRRDQVRLEGLIRDHARHARGVDHAAERLDLDQVIAALGARALVEYFSAGDQLRAVVLVDGRCRIITLSSYGDALREAESLRFAMHRLARRHGTEASLAIAWTTLEHAAAALDAALLAPIARLIGDRELVLVPTMRLHALPWPALPSLHGRPVSVAPSAAQWVRAACAPRRRTGAVVLVAGPDLVFAEPELRSVGRHYPGAVRIRDRSATADRVQRAIDGARVAHIACHGHFRTDNPQFSSLRMVDGPLMVYDLERLRRAPDLIVLSACDTALSAVHPGDELVGLSSALFALGTRTLVAAVSPVDDEAAKTLMVDFHRRLARGGSPAAALAESQLAHGVIGFACFGAG